VNPATNWRTDPLGELCEVLDHQRKPITKRDRTAGPYPYYGATGILDHVEGYLFDEPLVLVGEDGAKWASGENTAFAIDGKCWVNNHAHVLRPLRTKILDSWLIYFLNHSDLTDFVSGLTVPKLNQGSLREISIPAPPLSDQRRIVGILDEAFEGIATAKANAEKNLQNARALFASYLQSAFASAWQTCELVPLSELATDITDGDHLPPPKSPTGVPFITIGNVAKDTRKIDFTDTFMVPRAYFDRLKENKRPRRGDVLYTVTGSFGIPVVVADDVEFCFQRHIGLIRPKPQTSTSWLCYLLLSPQIFAQANEKATGTAQKTVSLNVLRKFTVPKVQPKDQCTAAAGLDVLSTETDRLASIYQQKLAALDDLKKSLLHQAFSGEL
jgi:type I restriction enzyme S subunit